MNEENNKNDKEKCFNKKKSILIIVMYLIILIFGYGYYSYITEVKNIKKCISNMKYVEGATVLFLMDRKFTGEINVTMNDLVKNTILLKQNSKCPSGGKILINVKKDKSIVEIRCTIHGEVIDIDSSY